MLYYVYIDLYNSQTFSTSASMIVLVIVIQSIHITAGLGLD